MLLGAPAEPTDSSHPCRYQPLLSTIHCNNVSLVWAKFSFQEQETILNRCHKKDLAFLSKILAGAEQRQPRTDVVPVLEHACSAAQQQQSHI